MPRGSNYLRGKHLWVLPDPSDLTTHGTVNLYFLWPGESRGLQIFFSVIAVLFLFFETESRITWVVSNAAELKLALIPEPPISLCEFWDYRHGPTYPGTNSLPPLCMLMCSGACLF